MTRAIDCAQDLNDSDRARSWFYRILRRAIVDHHRMRREVPVADAGESIAATEEERASTCPCAHHLLGEIRPAYAELLRRVDEGEDDPADVAASLGISSSYFYVRLHRARTAS
jgi:DNA-directed RNA polymerase specialized sigma24 family protein